MPFAALTITTFAANGPATNMNTATSPNIIRLRFISLTLAISIVACGKSLIGVGYERRAMNFSLGHPLLLAYYSQVVASVLGF